MTTKESRARDKSAITLNSARFIENLIQTTETYRFCINVSSHARVTSQIIRRLAAHAIDE